MSTDLVTLTEDETLAHAQRCMARGRIRHLPVVRDGKLVGLVTHRDLLAAVTTHQVPLDDVARAFALAGDKKAGAVKVTVLP